MPGKILIVLRLEHLHGHPQRCPGIVLDCLSTGHATITTILLGWTLIFVGIAQFVFALHSQTPGDFFLKILAGALYGIIGVGLAFAPMVG